MTNTGRDILIGFRNRWRLLIYLQIFLCSIGPGLLLYLVFSDPAIAILLSVVTFFVATMIFRPWRISLKRVTAFIDKELEKAEFSTGLLLMSPDDISELARLQRFRVTGELRKELSHLKPEHKLMKTALFSSILILAGLFINRFELLKKIDHGNENDKAREILFRTADTVKADHTPPKLLMQQLKVVYPVYTGLGSFTASEMNVKLPEGSSMEWTLKWEDSISGVKLEFGDENINFEHSNDGYTGKLRPEASLFYNFSYEDRYHRNFTSDLYSVQLIKDQPPVIRTEGINQFTSFDLSEEKKLKFIATVTDDYGLGDIFMVATVGKGSGESIRFREERLAFENYQPVGKNKERLTGHIDLDMLNMEPGDELYFYVQASDLREPEANLSRSETFFLKIKDTASYEFEVEGTLGVDLMPDYFRSQRQLIIDTERLIAERSSMSKKEFNSRSNELGFDQKALRLKYGQFMGDEADSGIATDTDHSEEKGHDDLLEGYTHDHDSENEQGLVADKVDETAEDPLHKYVHNHDDPEEATLFTQSLKTKLRLAMNEMWDAELYLRLFKPAQSLPYQYKALKLLEEIKNAARIYVHRIGFDPPPIREDRRLSGKLDETYSYNRSKQMERAEVLPDSRKAIELLENLINSGRQPENSDLQLFERAGKELAGQAVEFPGRFLEALQQLKSLAEGEKGNRAMYISVQKGLLSSLPDAPVNPSADDTFINDLDELLLKELNRDDN